MQTAENQVPRRTQTASDLARAHRRFARVALSIHLCASALAIAMLAFALYMDQNHEVLQRRDHLLAETQVRASFLSRHLELLARELFRLGLRAEIDAFDTNPEPLNRLLTAAHDRSTLFGAGIAVIRPDGKVALSAPMELLAVGTSLAGEPWLKDLARSPTARVVPVSPSRDDALVYVVSPIISRGRYWGALLGALDIAHEHIFESGVRQRFFTVLGTRRGAIVFPSRPPAFARQDAWRTLFMSRRLSQPFVVDRSLAGTDTVVACAPVGGTRLLLFSLADRESLVQPARTRLLTRLAVGLMLTLAATGLLVLALMRSIRVFRRSEEAALREENLKLLGEATNLIAHEVKNALNGLRLGMDIVLRRKLPTGDGTEGPSRSASALRQELQRLTDFTSKLLTFSKGISPRLADVDLAELLRSVGELTQTQALDLSVALEIHTPEQPLPVKADPSLIHVVISNLMINGLEAAAANVGSQCPRPRVEAYAEQVGSVARVRVDDTGAGISDAVRARLFEPFVTGKPSGVGIGLCLSRKIARSHRGELLLDGAAPRTSFVLTLPLEEK